MVLNMYMACIYILYSSLRDKYYIGSTTDMQRRLLQHNSGHTSSTKGGRPWTCAFQSLDMSLVEARRIELKLKKWKSRVILEKIIHDGLLF